MAIFVLKLNTAVNPFLFHHPSLWYHFVSSVIIYSLLKHYISSNREQKRLCLLHSQRQFSRSCFLLTKFRSRVNLYKRRVWIANHRMYLETINKIDVKTVILWDSTHLNEKTIALCLRTPFVHMATQKKIQFFLLSLDKLNILISIFTILGYRSRNVGDALR